MYDGKFVRLPLNLYYIFRVYNVGGIMQLGTHDARIFSIHSNVINKLNKFRKDKDLF